MFWRWLRFNAVGVAGMLVQLSLLALLTRAGLHYLVSTLVAVECALLHNYWWHVRWTWKGVNAPLSLLRFHCANGAVSAAGNLFVMRWLTGSLQIAPVPANIAAIAATSLMNFALCSWWVFPGSGCAPVPPPR